MWKGAIVGDSGNVALLSHGQFRSFLAFRTDHEAKNHRRSWQTQMATRRDARTPTQNAPSISSRCAHKPFIFPTSKTLINQTNSTHFSAFTRSPVSQRKYFEKNSTFQAPKTASRIFQKKKSTKIEHREYFQQQIKCLAHTVLYVNERLRPDRDQ